MSKPSPYPLIFTDLDGTLLDHATYSAKPANMLVQRITDQAVGSVIPITSKTRAELRSLEESIPIGKMISVTENGSAIHVPQDHPVTRAGGLENVLLGTGYAEILKKIDALPQTYRQHIRGFADMSAAEIAKATGLGLDAARSAKDREASEPFIWSGSDTALHDLGLLMADANIRIQRGGRYFHFTGAATKAQAMARIKENFAQGKPRSLFLTIALGDGPNDLGMIEEADIGVIMPNPDGVSIQSDKSHVRVAPAPGPQGWALAVRELFSEMGIILQES